MKRFWYDIPLAEATDIVLPRDDVIGPLNEFGELCAWPWEPLLFEGQPIGMYHCGYCGTMVIAGQTHVDYRETHDGLE